MTSALRGREGVGQILMKGREVAWSWYWQGEGGGPKSRKFRRRHMYMPPYSDSCHSAWWCYCRWGNLNSLICKVFVGQKWHLITRLYCIQNFSWRPPVKAPAEFLLLLFLRTTHSSWTKWSHICSSSMLGQDFDRVVTNPRPLFPTDVGVLDGRKWLFGFALTQSIKVFMMTGWVKFEFSRTALPSVPIYSLLNKANFAWRNDVTLSGIYRTQIYFHNSEFNFIFANDYTYNRVIFCQWSNTVRSWQLSTVRKDPSSGLKFDTLGGVKSCMTVIMITSTVHSVWRIRETTIFLI